MKVKANNILLIVLMASMLLYAGCTGARYYSLNSPEHHYLMGMKLMGRYNLDDVEREFALARELDADFVPAYVGLALVTSARGDFDGAVEKLEKAREKSKTAEDNVAVAMGTIKVYTDLYIVDKGRGEASSWLQSAEEAYRQGLGYKSKDPALHFFMGRAYKVAGKYDKAVASFQKVLELRAGYTVLAEEELSYLSKGSSEKEEQ